jgi:hypothetical protein
MSLLKAQAVADAIAANGLYPLQHPGNPDTKQPSASMIIPIFHTKGRPPPFDDVHTRSNQTIAEAIVYYIEKTLDCTIIPNTELNQLRLEAAQDHT